MIFFAALDGIEDGRGGGVGEAFFQVALDFVIGDEVLLSDGFLLVTADGDLGKQIGIVFIIHAGRVTNDFATEEEVFWDVGSIADIVGGLAAIDDGEIFEGNERTIDGAAGTGDCDAVVEIPEIVGIGGDRVLDFFVNAALIFDVEAEVLGEESAVAFFLIQCFKRGGAHVNDIGLHGDVAVFVFANVIGIINDEGTFCNGLKGGGGVVDFVFNVVTIDEIVVERFCFTCFVEVGFQCLRFFFRYFLVEDEAYADRMIACA